METTKLNEWEGTRNDLVAVTTTAILISNARKRNLIYLRNSSTGGQNITLSFGRVAVPNYGIVLTSGSSFSDSVSEGYTPYQGDISVISSASGGQLSVIER